MSGKNDRRETAGRRLVLAAAVITLAAAGAGGLLWFLRAGTPQPERTQTAGQRHDDRPAQREEPFAVTLYLPAGNGLAAIPAEVQRRPDVQLQARAVVERLLENDRGGQAEVLTELRLRALYLDPSGTAVLDLGLRSPDRKELRASVGGELLALYALVNTVTQNIPEVRQVRIIMDGREAQTLAGHIDLSTSFAKRTDLVTGR